MPAYCYFIAVTWSKGAISQHLQALGRHLVAQGHKVIYLSDGKQKIRIDEGNLQVYSFPTSRPTSPVDFIFLQQLTRQYLPDCMIINFGAENVMNIIGLVNGVPNRINWYHTPLSAILIDSQNTRWKNRLLVARKWLIYQLAVTGFIANSELSRLDLIAQYGIDTAKITVFPNSIADIAPSLIDDIVRDPRLIICPGRLAGVKGQDILIRALGLLHQGGIMPHVIFVGGADKRNNKLEELKALAVQLGVQEQCQFVGEVSHSEMFKYFASAGFSIVPSRSEAFGLVNIESMSVRTPVIASAVGGIPEIIRDGVDGFLVPPEDPQALAEKIKLLYNDPVLREQLGYNARERFLDVFEGSKNIERQALWFEEVVRKTHKTK